MKRLLFLMIAALALLWGCARQDDGYSTAFFAMDTIMEITVYGGNARQAVAAAAEKVNKLDHLLSVTNPNSEIYAINHAAGAGTEISAETFDVVSKALGISRRTGGAMDISIYPVVLAWGFTSEAARVPAQEELDALLSLVDYRAVQAEGGVVTLPDGAMLDLGSIAKGYCGDAIAALLNEAGVSSALLNLGGNIHTIGTKPDGSKWNVAVQDPLNSANYIGVVAVENKAVVTSGGYERYFKQNGQTYWHIMNPQTGKPAQNGIISVTVISESGTLCDGLSTALFVMGLEKALEHYAAYGDFEAIIITDDMRVTITPGLKDAFTLDDSGGRYTLAVYGGGE